MNIDLLETSFGLGVMFFANPVHHTDTSGIIGDVVPVGVVTLFLHIPPNFLKKEFATHIVVQFPPIMHVDLVIFLFLYPISRFSDPSRNIRIEKSQICAKLHFRIIVKLKGDFNTI